MAREAHSAPWQYALIALSNTFIGVIVIIALYWGRSIFIPLALAVLLTFILAPLVNFLQRRGLNHVLAVSGVVLLTLLLFVGISWIVTQQVAALTDELPQHTEQIKDRIQSIKDLVQKGGGSRMVKMLDEISSHLFKPVTGSGGNSADSVGPPPPPPVAQHVVVSSSTPWLSFLSTFVAYFAEFLAQFTLALVLFIFMLYKRGDLLNRMVILAGLDRMTTTNRAVHDAGQRLSRFLRMQLIINTTYGLILGTGLYFFGVPLAFLWGFLAGLLRYAPYVGPLIGAFFPVTLSLVLSTNWTQPLLVIGLIIFLEVILANLVEPRLYGKTMGVSEVALLTAAAFWAYLWGPVGLVLSGPLTVCMLVLGKYVPSLHFLDVLLSDEPILPRSVRFYQSLASRDQNGALEILKERLEDKSTLDTIYDDLLIPALVHARQDRIRGALHLDDEQAILHIMRELLDHVRTAQNQVRSAQSKDVNGVEVAPVPILFCPARDDFDQVGVEMFQQLLKPGKWDVHTVDANTLAAELVAQVEDRKVGLICIGSLVPGGWAHTRYLCKRLRSQFPNLRILIGRWGAQIIQETNHEHTEELEAESVTVTLLDTQRELEGWFGVQLQPKQPTQQQAQVQLSGKER